MAVPELTVPCEFFAWYVKVQVAAAVPAGAVALKPPLESTLTLADPVRPVQGALTERGAVAVARLTVSGYPAASASFSRTPGG